MQIDNSFVNKTRARMIDTQARIVCGLTEAMTDRLKPGLCHQCLDAGQIRLRHLHHNTQLFGKQRREGVITQAANITVQSTASGKCHFGEADDKPTVGAIVISEQQLLRQHNLQGFKGNLEHGHIVHIRAEPAKLAIHLG